MGRLSITNSTVSSNLANYGGALFLKGEAALDQVTTAGNQAAAQAGGQAIYVTADSPGVTLTRSIVWAKPGNPSCVHAANLVSGGYNLLPDQSCGSALPTDLVGLDPHLGSLKDNGGPTATQALLPDSPAIDMAVCAEGISSDQRGVARPQGAVCDAGAFEFEDTAAKAAYLPFVIR